MSFWDDFRRTAGQVVQGTQQLGAGIGKGLLGYPGAIVSGTTQAVVATEAAPYTQNNIQQPIAPGQQVAQQGLNQTFEVSNKAMEALRVPFQTVAERGAASVVALNPNLPYFGKPGEALRDIQENKQISIGQAINAAFLNKETAKKIDWTGKGEIAGLESTQDFFNRGYQKWTSGALDFTANFALDPLIYLGKTAKIARLATLVRPVRTEQELALLSQQIDDGARGAVSPFTPLINRIAENPTASSLVGEDIVTSGSRGLEIMQAIERAPLGSRESYAEILKVGIGVVPTQQKLLTESAIVRQDIEKLMGQNAYNKSMLDTGMFTLNHKVAIENKIAENTEVLNELIKRDKFLYSVVGEGSENAPGVFGSMGSQTVARWQWLEEVRGNVVKKRAESIFEESKYVGKDKLPVRMLTWVTEGGIIREVPSGMVKVEGVAVSESYREVLSNIQKVVELSGLNSQWGKLKFDEYTALQTKVERSNWLNNFESESLSEIMIKEFNLDRSNETLIKGIQKFSKVLIEEQGNARRGNFKKLFSSNYTILDDNGESTAVHGMKGLIETLAGESGLTVKQMQERFANVPLSETQYPSVHVLTNFDDYATVIKENPQRFRVFIKGLQLMAAQAEGVAKRTDIQTKPKSKFTKVSQKDIDALIEEARNISLNSGGLNERFQSGFNIARDGFTTAFDLFQTTIWKPAVLFRFGYTQRNVLEGWARTIAAMSMLSELTGTSLPSAYRGLKAPGTTNRIAKNTAERYRAMGARKNFDQIEYVARGRVAEANITYSQDSIFSIREELNKFIFDNPISAPGLEKAIADPAFQVMKESKVINEAQVAQLFNKIVDELDKFTPKAQKGIKSKLYNDIQVDTLAKFIDLQKEAKIFQVQYDAARVSRASLLDEIDKLTDLATVKLVRAGEGKFEVIPGVELPDVWSGVFGQIARKDASAEKTLQNTLMNGRTSNQLNSIFRASRSDVITPDNKFWGNAYVDFINKVVYNDPLYQMFLRGKTQQDVAAYLKSPQGRDTLANVQLSVDQLANKNIDKYAEVLYHQYVRLLPPSSMTGIDVRTAALNGKMTEQLALQLPSDVRPSIFGTELYPGNRSAGAILNKAVKGVFKYIGTLPEDKLVRQPFYRSVYRMEAARIARLVQAQGMDLNTEKAQGLVVRMAHQRARKTLNETLYTVERYTNPGNFMRFASPFYMAHQNSSRFWISKSIQNPTIPYLGLVLWNSPNKALETRDPQGRIVESSLPFYSNETIYMTMKKGPVAYLLKKFGPYEDESVLKFNKTSADLFFGGSFPALPQLSGPLVDVLAATVFKKPVEKADEWLSINMGVDNNALQRYVLPFYNPETRVWNKILPSPAWLRALVTSSMEDRSPQFAARVDMNIENNLVKLHEEGGVLNDKTMAEATDKAIFQTKRGYLVEAIFGVGSPISTKIGTSWELQKKLLRLYQTKYGQVEGLNRFSDEFGATQASYAKTSTSSNQSGLLGTPQTVRNIEANLNLVKRVSFLDESVIGSFFNGGEYKDYTTVAEARLKGIRVLGKPLKGGAVDTKTKVLNAEAYAGFSLYIPAADAIKAKAKAEGERAGVKMTPNSVAYQPYQDRLNILANYVGQTYPEFLKRLKNPEPKRVFDTVEAIKNIVSDPTYQETVGKNNKVAQGALVWLEARESVAVAVANKQATLSQGQERMDEVVDYMRNNGFKDFANFYDFNLHGDTLNPIGFRK